MTSQVKPVAASPRRAVIFALDGRSPTVDGATISAISALREYASHLIVTVPGSVDLPDERLAELSTQTVRVSSARFAESNYLDGIAALHEAAGDFDEVVLTGNGWFGPLESFAAVLKRMDSEAADGWQMIQPIIEPDEAYETPGGAREPAPWMWFVARSRLLVSEAWESFWGDQARSDQAREARAAQAFREVGLRILDAFDVESYPTRHPQAYVADVLIDDGFPFLRSDFFGWYPPYLDRNAVIGRDALDAAARFGVDRDLALSALARTADPRTLNANAGLLEILPQKSRPFSPEIANLRIAAVVYARDRPAFEQLCTQLSHLPRGFDLIITTTDGRRASQLERFVESRDIGHARLDVRVTPSRSGRDMADFFVGCRDVLLDGQYDLVVKVHARKHRKKTLNLVRYFTRYQTENLLGSPDGVASLLTLFATKPHLGLVYPPMMHIGYSIIGSGWGGERMRASAMRLLAKLEVSVPLERVSPLAPYGGMWVCRPEALAPIARMGHSYHDYWSGAIKDLARVEERIVSHVAASEGYYTQTVLTPEHAAISHTAIDYKVDQMLSTTHGHPVDAIRLIQKAGRMSGRGALGLSRMYLTLNHPLIAQFVSPVYRAAYVVLGIAKVLRRRLRELRKHVPMTWREF